MLRSRSVLFPALGAVCSLLILFLPTSPVHAISCLGSQLAYSDNTDDATTFGVCGGWGRCQQPVGTLVSYSFNVPGCDPTAGSCAMTATVNAQFPGNHQNNPGLTGFLYSFAEVDLRDSTGSYIAACGTSGAVIAKDRGVATVSASVSCLNPGPAKYTVELTACPTCPPCPSGGPPGSCIKTTSVPLDFAGAGAADCPVPPPDDCNTCGGCVASGGGGPAGCSNPARGGGPACSPQDSGPGAHLRYRAGGAGGPGLPASTAWKTALGLYWSHEHAQRIVVAPNFSHVWLITERASFREFSNLASGSGLRLYQTNAPSDEYRKLYYDTSTGTWQLDSLDGRKEYFRSDGLWDKTVFSQSPTHAIQATYNGSNELTSVSFPDGRSEDYTYSSGRLATITEQPVSGSGTSPRTWTYTWSTDELTQIDRPDGTAWKFTYDPTKNGGRTGYVTRIELVGTDGVTTRVEAAFEYDASGNVIKAWRGDTSYSGSNAVDKQELTYTNPSFPTQTDVLEWIDATHSQTTVYEYDRDPRSIKARINRVTGDCPVCGTGPNAQFTYADSANPLRPTQIVDGRGLTTQFAYNANGLTTSKTEAVGTGLQRLTSWQYSNSSFPGLPTRIEVPSTAGGMAVRATVLAYDSDGNLTTRTITGSEGGSSFSYATTATFNGAGKPLTVNPPGYTTTDQTSYTYDSGRGDFVLQTWVEPIVGTTTFLHDGFNRRTSVTDPNGVDTLTAFDALNRVTSVTQEGATPPTDDLVTTHQYDLFGDLFRTLLPEGNLLEYGYDAAGRLVSIERRPNTSTHGDRSFYTLDLVGHRTKEERQHWNGSAWVTDSFTDFVYSTRCHLDKVVNADGTVTERTYDCNGNLEKLWDPNHPRGSNPTPTRLYAYDSLNRLTSVTQPWTGGGGSTAVTSYTYDVQDHLASLTDAESNATTYTYSDRDLMTQEVSPVSGTTTYAYNEHGKKVQEVDARPVTIAQTWDAADRLTFINYPNNSLDTTFTYDTPGSFATGRMTSIARGSSTVSYTYDRFGRTLQDGALTSSYDKNGNLLTLQYPNNVTATYTYDYADRQSTLVMQDGANPSQTLVSSSSYKPFGPLASLTLGNGLTETHAFSTRYLPTSISVPSLLSWSYTTDSVGNPNAIADTLNSANDRTYDYQDPQYFLTTGDGPWGTQSLTYDKIGNRLTITRTGATDTYGYVPNGSFKNQPLIDQITPSAGPGLNYVYDAVGNVLDDGVVPYTYDDDRRMSELGTNATLFHDTFVYDGRGYLSHSSQLPLGGLHSDDTLPTYSSSGLLLHRFAHQSLQPFSVVNPVHDSDLYVFYFAGRPVAHLDNVVQGHTVGGFTTTSTLRYITVDHLGTPILLTSTAGAQVWQGGFDPFGEDYSTAATVLRFPGQWFDTTWNDKKSFGLYYNLNRWYKEDTGRYTQPDPLGLQAGVHLYQYAVDNPISYIDRDGLLGSPPFVVTPDELWPFTCSASVAQQAREINASRHFGWRWAHCWASCNIIKMCGGRPLAKTMEWGKELLDVVKCFPEIVSFRKLDPDRNCASALQPSDFEDNEFGRSCPRQMGCDERCSPLIGKTSEPGPMYPIARGTQWFLEF